MMGTDVPHQLRTRPSVGWDVTRLRKALLDSIPNDRGVMLTVVAPAVEGLVALRLADETPSFYWRPARPAPTVVGWGAAVLISARGAERFEQARVQAQAALQALQCATVDNDGVLLNGASTPITPRVFGGFAFQPGATDHAIWQGFQDAGLILPRFRYVLHGEHAELALTLTAHELRNDHLCEQWLARLPHLQAALGDLANSVVPAPLSLRPPASAQARASAAEWNQQIQQILEAIQSAHCSKVVLARRDQRTFDRELSLPNTLAALQSRCGDEVTCFAFDFGTGVFLGATPETLVSKIGSSVTSEALAGSVSTADPDGARALLESAKDREEHRVVVQAIVDTLKPLSTQVSFDTQPQIRRLRHLLHLWTPITAQLSAPRHVLELVSLLHPTPAVGGTPTDWAVHWITEHESVPRGWYASPVGWFNGDGDGAFHVALRSGVLRGHDAFLYAGSGVVAKSDATAELAETELKLASLLDALRAE
jgi:isochorismate synthase